MDGWNGMMTTGWLLLLIIIIVPVALVSVGTEFININKTQDKVNLIRPTLTQLTAIYSASSSDDNQEEDEKEGLGKNSGSTFSRDAINSILVPLPLRRFVTITEAQRISVASGSETKTMNALSR